MGLGLGGFVDGIVLHQILQWHHMLTDTGDHPMTTVAGLEANTLADGFFHLANVGACRDRDVAHRPCMAAARASSTLAWALRDAARRMGRVQRR